MESASDKQRLRLVIRGAVQGVGFRPFVYRLATQLGLTGWVKNTSQGVFVEVEGPAPALSEYVRRVDEERPPRSFIASLEATYLDPVGFASFEVRPSDQSGQKTALVLPDIATCSECLGEVLDPANRRYLYPFTNCTNCGPRFSIIAGLPYDRRNTTMRRFTMCPECQAEYDDPADRRFHAQPNACPVCGPHLELWDGEGRLLATCHDALLAAVQAIQQGGIVAVKGLGGFHLMVDAGDQAAVLRLRQAKRREERPLALMYPSIEAVEADCEVSPQEHRLLQSPETPIVLLRRRQAAAVSPSVAPGNPNLGAMLPYTPLHHILLRELAFPVVATSGNLTDEPICTDEHEALDRLRGIADLFLVHDRPVARHVDDSVARVMLGRELLLRRARGYAPLPIPVSGPLPRLLGVGAHLKNTVAAAIGDQVFVSQHVGDLETSQARAAFARVIDDFGRLYEFRPEAVACDAHPDYLSTRYAQATDLPAIAVQHHQAHILSCMAENEVSEPLLGVAWDGTGYGLDGTVWGGEFLHVQDGRLDRVATFRSFPLPGSEQAVREPRRSALGLLHEIGEAGEPEAFSPGELPVLRTMLDRGLNCPRSSSVGRLFDAVASLVRLRQRARFEGQAAMELEFALHGVKIDDTYAFDVCEADGIRTVDWEPMIRELLAERDSVSAGVVSAKFHNTLAEVIVAVAHAVGESRVVLSGGCFQNRYLTERAVRRLEADGFRPYWHQRVPPNDGGIALGQVIGASLALRED